MVPLPMSFGVSKESLGPNFPPSDSNGSGSSKGSYSHPSHVFLCCDEGWKRWIDGDSSCKKNTVRSQKSVGSEDFSFETASKKLCGANRWRNSHDQSLQTETYSQGNIFWTCLGSMVRAWEFQRWIFQPRHLQSSLRKSAGHGFSPRNVTPLCQASKGFQAGESHSAIVLMPEKVTTCQDVIDNNREWR